MQYLLFRSTMWTLAFLVLGATLITTEAEAMGPTSSRTWVGVVLGDADSQPGVEVDVVLRRSPAHQAGLQDGDRILSVNRRTVRTPGKLESILGQQRPGRTITMSVERDGSTLDLEIEVSLSPSASRVLELHHRGFPLPDLELTDLDGDKIDLTASRDAPLVLEFWATWCTVCRQVSRKLEGALEKSPDSFEVLSVTGEDADTVREHLATHPKAHEIALDPDSRAHDALLVHSYPFLLVIDPDGEVIAVTNRIDNVDSLIEDLVADQ